MNGQQERVLYETDRPTWIKQVAPGMARSLMLLDPDGMARVLRVMDEDYREAVKAHLSADEYARVKKAIAAITKRGRNA